MLVACNGGEPPSSDEGSSTSTGVEEASSSRTGDETVTPTSSTAAGTSSGPGDETSTGTDTTGPPPGVDPEQCRIAFPAAQQVGVGFPVPQPRLPALGTVRGTVLFVDFQDFTAQLTPQEVFAMVSPGAEQRFEAMSYGGMQLVLEPHLQWLRLSQDAADYGAGLTSGGEHRAFIQEAVSAADADVDFSETDVLIVLSAPNAAGVPYGPTWMGVPGFDIVADGNVITNGVTSGHDLLYWGSAWLNHELGHSMSLPDLYNFGAGPPGFTRPFSLMDLIDSSAPELMAWERWQLGWLDDSQVACDAIDADVSLTAIETAGGTKAAIVRTSETRVLVAESRRALGYDALLGEEGVVVSVVDASIPSGSGPIQVLNGQAVLGVGGSVTADGFVVEVIASDDDGDVVRFSPRM